MSDSLDKETESRDSLSVSEGAVLPFEKPRKFINIPDEVLKTVSQYMPIVIGQASPNRSVDVENILKNAKNMFREGHRYHSGFEHNDNLWMQHCAASMREILCFLEPDYFNKAFSSIPHYSSEDPRAERFFIFLIRSNAYLSAVVHFQNSSKVGHADKLYPNEGYGSKDQDTFLKEESSFFEGVCIDIVYALHDLFATYCIGGEQADNENEHESN